MGKTYYVYIMTNRSRVVLYTGVTNSIESRLWFHATASAKSFTKRYKVNQLVGDPSHSFGMTRPKLARGRTIDYIPTEIYRNGECGIHSSRRVESCDLDLSVSDVPSRLRG